VGLAPHLRRLARQDGLPQRGEAAVGILGKDPGELAQGQVSLPRPNP